MTEYQPVISTTSGVVSAIARPISGTSRPVKDAAVDPIVSAAAAGRRSIDSLR